MNKEIKIMLLELLNLVIFLIISNFIEINPFSFCLGSTYIMIFDVINKMLGSDSNAKD